MIQRTLLPHTADVRLKVEADSLEGLFEGALQGMADLLKAESCSDKFSVQLSQNFAVSAIDLTALLIDFLSYVLTASFEKKAVICQIKIDELTSQRLNGIIYGSYIDEFEEDIKAVTYHEANVVQNDQGNWETVIIFDI